MSQAFRNRRSNGSARVPSNIAARNANVDTSTQDNHPLMGGDANEYFTDPGAHNFPTVGKETRHVMAGWQDASYPSRQFSNHDPIDYEVGGEHGKVNGNPYSVGVVSSDAVENFSLDGRQAIIRRGRNPSDVGPVGTSDHNTLIGLALAQSVNAYYPNERSQSDVVRAV